MSNIQLKDISGSVSDIDEQARTVKAVWAHFGNVDHDGDIIIPEAVVKTIRERGPLGSKSIWSLTDHNACLKSAIGKPKELYVEGNNLIAITEIVDTEWGEDVIKMYQSGIIQSHSIGFSTIKADWQDNSQQVRIIKELKLYEGSAVLWPANDMTPTLGVYKGAMTKESASERLTLLLKEIKTGSYSDSTFELLELQIKQIQSLLTTQAAQALEPDYTKQISEELLKLHLKLI